MKFDHNDNDIVLNQQKDITKPFLVMKPVGNIQLGHMDIGKFEPLDIEIHFILDQLGWPTGQIVQLLYIPPSHPRVVT